MSLLVKRLEQRVRFVDQLLNALAGRILTARTRGETDGRIRDQRA
jgi:hypothetical protein